MAEYIEREAAIAKIREEGVYGSGYSNAEREDNVVDMLLSVPAADVRPVVLCRDCKHRQYDAVFGESWCNGERVTDNWFCADGEKREKA